MPRNFAGSTAGYYRRYRRDVPGVVLDRLVDHLALTSDVTAIDVGAGTGQVTVPLAARIGMVWALDPEPDMLALLRRRTRDDDVENVLCVLASDRDLPLLTGALGDGACSLVTIANAVHWMDAPGVFAACSSLLPSGGGRACHHADRPPVTAQAPVRVGSGPGGLIGGATGNDRHLVRSGP